MSIFNLKNPTNIDTNPFAKHTHVKLLDVTEQGAHAYIDLCPELMNPYGSVHGGVYFTLADTCAGFAARADGRFYVTQQASSQFIRTVNEGRITAEGVVVNRGKNVCFVEVFVRDEAQRLLFQATFNYFCLGSEE